MKLINVAIIGRPSSGKSTFINTITENKVSIVSSHPQSTLWAVNARYTDSRGTIVFTDTPGLHISSASFNTRLSKTAINAIRNSNCVLYIIDGCDKIGDEEKRVMFYAKTSNKPVVVLINKNDAASKNDINEKLDFVNTELRDLQYTVHIGSALNDEGLDEVLIEIFKFAKEVGDLPENLDGNSEFTDAPLERRVAEEIRESVFENTRLDIPHAVFVDVQNLVYKESENTVLIDAVIFVERDSQKGILIGKGGATIGKIRKSTLPKLRQIFPSIHVDLKLNIKVHPGWRKDENLLKKLGL